MARNTNALRPAFPEDALEDALLEEEEKESKEEPKDTPEQDTPEQQNESEDDKVVEIPDKEDDEEEEVDYLAELAEKQKKRKQLRKLEREIKEEPTVRKTFLVEEELLNIILSLSKKYGYAFQTKFINSAIKRELMRIGHYPPKKKMG